MITRATTVPKCHCKGSGTDPSRGRLQWRSHDRFNLANTLRNKNTRRAILSIFICFIALAASFQLNRFIDKEIGGDKRYTF